MSGLGCKDCDPAREISRDAREDPLIPEVHWSHRIWKQTHQGRYGERHDS